MKISKAKCDLFELKFKRKNKNIFNMTSLSITPHIVCSCSYRITFK